MRSSPKPNVVKLIEYLTPVIFLSCLTCGLSLIGFESMKIIGHAVITTIFCLIIAYLFRVQSSRQVFWAGFAIGGVSVLLIVVIPSKSTDPGHLTVGSRLGLDRFYARQFPQSLLRSECAQEMACSCLTCESDYFERHKTMFNISACSTLTLFASVMFGICAQIAATKLFLQRR